ncbi:hypothetical protein L195_g020826, partial [Trifolium pratense]
ASSDESSKEIQKEASDEELHIPETGGSADSENETNSAPDPELPILEKISDEKPQTSNDLLSEVHPDGDDGWQSVQRPRSAGSYGRRVKQRRATLGKVYSYQKNVEVGTEQHPSVKSATQNSKYYFLKKRTTHHGGYADNRAVNISQGTKFGRKAVKAVAYRVKSTPSASKTIVNETPEIGDKEPDSVDVNPVKTPIVSLGKSPSYKEVALAPPGTISKLQVYNPQSEIPISHERDVGKHKEEDIEAHRNINPTPKEANNAFKEKSDDSLSDSIEDSQDDTVVSTEMKEETQLNKVVQDNCVTSEGLESGDVEAQGAVDNSIVIDGVENVVDSYTQELITSNLPCSFEPSDNINSSPRGSEDLGLNLLSPSQSQAGGISYKKLSASAAPFNPSPAIARAAPIAMNMTHPSGPGPVPGIGPWPVNMNVHPGPGTVLPAVNPMCSSPHHAYPSPPTTPNMMQPLPFMYPPYTQPQSIQTSSAFHANHFTWQCNLNPVISKFGPGAVWTGCHPVEFPRPVPIVESIPDIISEPQVHSYTVESPSSASVLLEDIDKLGDSNKEVKTSAPEINEDGTVRVDLESIKENGNLNFSGTNTAGNEPNQNVGSNNSTNSSEMNMDDEKTFSILIRGRRNRKQTLRMPISLLTRPHGSQSFKVIYNRVVRGNDSPRSINFSSSKHCTASA